ncbi:hypothetical protein VN1242_09490 [Helicobacter pylori]
MKSLIASLAPLVGCAVRISPGLLSLLGLMPVKEFYAKNAEICNALQEANHMDKSFRVVLKE